MRFATDFTLEQFIKTEFSCSLSQVLSCFCLTIVELLLYHRLEIFQITLEGFDKVLFAIGRHPLTETLGLDKAGVE